MESSKIEEGYVENVIEELEVIMQEDAFIEKVCKVYHPGEEEILPCIFLIYGRIAIIADIDRINCYSGVVVNKFSDFKIEIIEENSETIKLNLVDTVGKISTHELIFEREEGQSFISEYNDKTPMIIEFETKLMSGIECPECGEFMDVKKKSALFRGIATLIRWIIIFRAGKYTRNDIAKYECLNCGSRWK